MGARATVGQTGTGNDPAKTIPWLPSVVPSALSPHTRDKVAIVLLYKLITPRPPQLVGLREASHGIPKTVHTDNNETDIKAGASTI